MHLRARSLTPADDCAIHRALIERYKRKTLGLLVGLQRMRTRREDVNRIGTWENPIKALHGLINIQNAIICFEGVSIRFPDDVKTLWVSLAETVRHSTMYDRRTLRNFLIEQISELECCPRPSVTNWRRRDFPHERTVRLTTFHNSVIHFLLEEQWEDSIYTFLSLLDRIEIDEYEDWTQPQALNDLHDMLEDLRALQDAFMRFDGTTTEISFPRVFQGAQKAMKGISQVENAEGTRQCSLVLEKFRAQSARQQDSSQGHISAVLSKLKSYHTHTPSTMADVRALLKAKRQEARITHPYAAYTSAGQLKCTVCSTPVKHASAWEGHLGSKAHRTNVIRLREEEKQRQLQKEREQQQQNMDQDDDEGDEDEDEDEDKAKDERGNAKSAPGKRAAPSDDDAVNPAGKKRKVDTAQSTPGGFPQDFFSDPSRGPILLPDDDDEEEEADSAAADASKTQPAAPEVPKSDVDLEYERFQRELLATAAETSTTDAKEAFQRATVFAEPVAASTEIAGFPPANASEPVEATPAALTEEEIRQKKEQEERELIMDRLLEEERAQEDADTKVQMLKNRIEALRKKREEAKAKKAASKAS